MCPVNLENNKQMIITTHAQVNESEWAICGYDLDTNTKRWCVTQATTEHPMSPQGLTADGNGQLCVCDYNNNCIQIFSTDGKYKGILLKRGEQDLEQPWSVRCCNSKSLLVVLHRKDKTENLFSFIKV